MIRALGNFFSGLARRWLPDAFLFAIILTLICYIAGIVGEGRGRSG